MSKNVPPPEPATGATSLAEVIPSQLPRLRIACEMTSSSGVSVAIGKDRRDRRGEPFSTPSLGAATVATRRKVMFVHARNADSIEVPPPPDMCAYVMQLSLVCWLRPTAGGVACRLLGTRRAGRD